MTKETTSIIPGQVVYYVIPGEVGVPNKGVVKKVYPNGDIGIFLVGASGMTMRWKAKWVFPDNASPRDRIARPVAP